MADKYSELLIDRILSLCKKRGLTIYQLSQMSGVSHSTLDDFINRNALGVDVLSGLCTVPECEIGELLEFIPPEK